MLMRLIICLCTAFLIVRTPVFCQTTSQYIEQRYLLNTGISVFGNGSLASFDFESAFKVKNEMHLCIKTGIGQNIIEHDCQPVCVHTTQYDMATLPIHLIGLIYVAKKRKGESFLELGIGSTFAISEGDFNYLVYPIIGYRVYPFRYLPLHYRIYTHLPYTKSRPKHFSGYYTPFGLSLGYSLQ